MYNKYLRYATLASLCFVIFLGYFLSDSQEEPVVTDDSENIQTVIFKDETDTLIPVSVDIGNENEPEKNYRGIIEMMKSSDYTAMGLYPLLDPQLEINTLIMEQNQLTFDFNDYLHVKNNQEALDICEAFSYLFCNDGIEKVNIQIEGQQVSSLDNSTIPLSCITQQLGINNFETSTSKLYKTSSVVVYNEKNIDGQTYYVPVTTRIDDTENSLDTKVSLLLDHFDNPVKIKTAQECTLADGILSVYLSSQILNDSESISPILYQRLEKSLLSIPDVSQVEIYIDDQLIEKNQEVTSIIDNKIQI